MKMQRDDLLDDVDDLLWDFLKAQNTSLLPQIKEKIKKDINETIDNYSQGFIERLK